MRDDSADAWALLHPIILCGLYSFVFVVVIPPSRLLPASARTPSSCWRAFCRGSVFRGDRPRDDLGLRPGALVKKAPVPVELGSSASSAAAALVLQLAGFSCSGLVVVTGRGDLQPAVLLLRARLRAVLLAGPCSPRVLNVFFRDLSQLVSRSSDGRPLPHADLYRLPRPGALAPFLALNPVSDLVALFRAALFGGPSRRRCASPTWTGAFLRWPRPRSGLFRR